MRESQLKWPENVCKHFKFLFFQVDSHEFAGQKHKWLVTQLLIKGHHKSYETMLNNLAKSIYLLGNLVPLLTFLTFPVI